jgi:hypothetical protein
VIVNLAAGEEEKEEEARIRNDKPKTKTQLVEAVMINTSCAYQ